MPATRTGAKPKETTRQLTLTGELASVTPLSKSRSRSSIERIYTDAILSIKPEFIELIAAREKNHEYRGYKMRDTVIQIWLYTTTPISAITYDFKLYSKSS